MTIGTKAKCATARAVLAMYHEKDPLYRRCSSEVVARMDVVEAMVPRSGATTIGRPVLIMVFQ